MRREPALNYGARLARETGLARLPGPRGIVASSGALVLLREFQNALRNSPGDVAEIRRLAVAYARRVWRFACASTERDVFGLAVAEPGTGDFVAPDLAAYWLRLRMLAVLGAHLSGRLYADVDSRITDRCLRMFDLISRNQIDAGESEPNERVAPLWITGFDPYGLSADRPDSLWNTNPSGAAVLALHGRRLVGRSQRTYRIRGALFPVRYRDFDEACLEGFLRRRVARDCPLLFTISMGAASDAFHLDRYPANRRGGAADNAGETPRSGPVLTDSDPQFVECSLGADRINAMVSVSGPFAVIDYREVETRERGRFVANGGVDLAGASALCGSGGDYLSNEITYRAIHEIQKRPGLLDEGGGAWSALETVHVHTPRVGGGDKNAPEAVRRIVEQILAMLIAAG